MSTMHALWFAGILKLRFLSLRSYDIILAEAFEDLEDWVIRPCNIPIFIIIIIFCKPQKLALTDDSKAFSSEQ